MTIGHLAPKDIVKAAVIMPFGLFKYIRMPFGLRNAAPLFERFIYQVFLGLDFVYANVDVVLIYCLNLNEHKYHLRQVFQRLEQCGITTNPKKCNFCQSEIDYLGPSHRRTHYFTSAAEVSIYCRLALIVLKFCTFSPICSRVTHTILP